MRTEEMNEGVQILLKRMKTNPEEFEAPFGKWQHIVEQVMGRREDTKNASLFLHDEEMNALFDGLRNIERNKFTADIIRRLADVNEKGEQLDLPYIPSPTTLQRTIKGLK
jgi:hypothetical protein